MQITINKDGEELVINLIPDHIMGLSHAADIDNEGYGERPKFNEVQMMAKIINDYLEMATKKAEEYILTTKAEQFKNQYRDKTKREVLDAVLETVKSDEVIEK